MQRQLNGSSSQPHHHSRALACLIAYTLLASVAYLHSSDLFTLDTTIELQRLADAALTACYQPHSDGISHSVYMQHESLRRAILLACVLDDLFNTAQGFPLMVAEGLGPSLAPGARRLWRCSAEAWDGEWSSHIARWRTHSEDDHGCGYGLIMREMWGEDILPDSSKRFRQWLMEADEFGLWIAGLCQMAKNGRNVRAADQAVT